jgi:hypothetical protein
VILSGLASTVDLDNDRVRFRAYAFDNVYPGAKLPPLLLRHDRPAGIIERLFYDDSGCLMIVAHCSDPLASMMPAFSVAATILDFAIDKASATATVTRARIEEVSLTDRPANPAALVTARVPVSAAVALMDLAAGRLAAALSKLPEAKGTRVSLLEAR